MKRFCLLLLLWPLLGFAAPQVLVTVAPYKYMVERIAGNSVQVQVLVPAAASPHSFEPTSRDLVKASRSQLWLRIGEPFEKKSMAVLQDSNPHIRILDLRKGVIDCGDDDYCDNHIWLSLQLVKMQAKAIKVALSALLPQNEPLYQRSLDRFLADIDKLSAQFTRLFAEHPTKAVLVSHPAFAYFCRDYGITQLSVEQDGREPTIKQIDDLMARVKTLQVTKAILEPQHQNKGTLLIAEQLGLPTFLIDPYAENWYDNISYIASTFAS